MAFLNATSAFRKIDAVCAASDDAKCVENLKWAYTPSPDIEIGGFKEVLKLCAEGAFYFREHYENPGIREVNTKDDHDTPLIRLAMLKWGIPAPIFTIAADAIAGPRYRAMQQNSRTQGRSQIEGEVIAFTMYSDHGMPYAESKGLIQGNCISRTKFTTAYIAHNGQVTDAVAQGHLPRVETLMVIPEDILIFTVSGNVSGEYLFGVKHPIRTPVEVQGNTHCVSVNTLPVNLASGSAFDDDRSPETSDFFNGNKHVDLVSYLLQFNMTLENLNRNTNDQGELMDAQENQQGAAEYAWSDQAWNLSAPSAPSALSLDDGSSAPQMRDDVLTRGDIMTLLTKLKI